MSAANGDKQDDNSTSTTVYEEEPRTPVDHISTAYRSTPETWRQIGGAPSSSAAGSFMFLQMRRITYVERKRAAVVVQASQQVTHE